MSGAESRWTTTPSGQQLVQWIGHLWHNEGTIDRETAETIRQGVHDAEDEAAGQAVATLAGAIERLPITQISARSNVGTSYRPELVERSAVLHVLADLVSRESTSAEPSEPTRAAVVGDIASSRMWSAAYHAFRDEGVAADHAMARADLIRIEFDKHVGAILLACAPTPSEKGGLAWDVKRLARALDKVMPGLRGETQVCEHHAYLPLGDEAGDQLTAGDFSGAVVFEYARDQEPPQP